MRLVSFGYSEQIIFWRVQSCAHAKRHWQERATDHNLSRSFKWSGKFHQNYINVKTYVHWKMNVPTPLEADVQKKTNASQFVQKQNKTIQGHQAMFSGHPKDFGACLIKMGSCSCPVFFQTGYAPRREKNVTLPVCQTLCFYLVGTVRRNNQKTWSERPQEPCTVCDSQCLLHHMFLTFCEKTHGFF